MCCPRSFVASCVSFQLRPLPSTGITRLRQYYEPLRHPKRTGRSLASCQLIHTAITAGTSRVAHGPLCLHAVANTPAGRMDLFLIFFCSLVRFHSLRPSPKPGRVGSCITVFGACSAFTHVTACTLAKSPCDSLHQRLQQFRCLHCCSDCYRVERTSSRTGLTPAVDHHLFTAHPVSTLIRTPAQWQISNQRSNPVSYRMFCFFNSCTISLTTPSITFCADFGLNESLVPVQMNSPSGGVAA